MAPTCVVMGSRGSAYARLRRSAAFLLLLLVACVTPRPETQVRMHPSTDFGDFRSFAFAEGATKGIRSPLAGYLRAGARAELEGRGYRESSHPDVLVEFQLLDPGPERWQAPDSSRDVGESPPRELSSRDASLWVRLIDNRKRVVAWQGGQVAEWVGDFLADQREESSRAITDIFASYPYLAGYSRAVQAWKGRPAWDDAWPLAQAGDPQAQYVIGVLTQGGPGGRSKDLPQALDWYQQSAQQGFGPAQAKLGAYYLEESQGEERQALGWLRLAAEKGLSHSKYLLGRMYLEGAGAPEDPARAVTWLQAAAEEGVENAQVDLALLYLQGRGIEADLDRSAGLLARAASAGDARAQLRLGMLFEFGRGVAEDRAQAHAWYSLAALRENVEARSRRNDMHGRLTSEQLARSQELVASWSPGSPVSLGGVPEPEPESEEPQEYRQPGLPDPGPWLAAGDLAFQEGRYYEAAKAYARAGGESPDDAVVLLLESDARFASGEDAAAARLLRRALRISPDLAGLDLEQGAAYQELRQRRLEELQGYLDTHGYDEDVRILVAYQHLRAGDPEACLITLDAASNRALLRTPSGEALIAATGL